jgi:hypothetical protein
VQRHEIAVDGGAGFEQRRSGYHHADRLHVADPLTMRLKEMIIGHLSPTRWPEIGDADRLNASSFHLIALDDPSWLASSILG